VNVEHGQVDLAEVPAGVDWDRMRRHRLTRARETMAKHGLDAVLAFEYANGRYLADLRPLWAPNFLVRQAVVATPGSDDVICFVHQDDTPHRRQLMTWLPPTHVREFPTATVSGGAGKPLEPLVAALRELGFTGGRVGVDMLTPAVFANLRQALPDAELVDLNPCMYEARTVKNADELSLMRAASRIVDQAMATAIDAAVPGRRECEVLAEVMRVFYLYGAEVPQCNLIVCSGPNTAPMQRYAGDRRIEAGDLVFMDIGACFNGIFSEATRTVVCGEPNARQRQIYRTVHEIHEATIGAIRAGTTAAAVQEAAQVPYERSPFVGYMQRMIIAHGIGVGYAEPPFIPPPGAPPIDLALTEGMVFAVVPTILVPGVPGGGGVRLEDLVMVTAGGVERLTGAPYDERLLS
jgi:Xaa-Pro aminopeptidase